MRVYRICKAQYAHDLSGTGAERTGGRWNKRGTPMVYTSGSRALCVAEIAVHLPLGIIPKDFTVLTIEIPDSLPIGEIFESKPPKNRSSITQGEAARETVGGFLPKIEIRRIESSVGGGGRGI